MVGCSRAWRSRVRPPTRVTSVPSARVYWVAGSGAQLKGVSPEEPARPQPPTKSANANTEELATRAMPCSLALRDPARAHGAPSTWTHAQWVRDCLQCSHLWNRFSRRAQALQFAGSALLLEATFCFISNLLK